MKQDFDNYNELRAHYMAVRKRLGGLGNSPGLVPLRRPEEPKIVPPVVEEAPQIIWEVDGLPKNKFSGLLISVAQKYNISPKTIMQPNRRQNIIRIRREFVYQAVKELGYSASQVGRWLQRDHTTILHDVHCYERDHAPTA